MKKITINGTFYLGDLKEGKDGKMTLKNAMNVMKGMDKKAISTYLKKKNLGELNDIEFGGKGVSFSVCDLTEEEQTFLSIGEMLMKSARNSAVQSIENNIFDDLLSK